MQITGLKLVRVRQQPAQIRYAIVAAAGRKGVRGRERHQRGVAPSTAPANCDAGGLGRSGPGKVAGGRNAVGDIGDAPSPLQALPVSTPKAAAAGVVDV